MSTPQRRPPAGVIARLLAEPHRFAFFQAVRLLDRWFGRQDPRDRVGTLTKRLSFRNTLSLGFPPSEIVELRVVNAVPANEPAAEPAPAGAGLDAVVDASLASRADAATAGVPDVERIEMTPAFMGLLGATGALPTFYTEALAERENYHRDTAARAFLDIFQHRAVSLFYQAWRRHRLPVQYEDDRHSSFLPLVLAVAGVGQGALRNRLNAREGGVADDTLAYFAGLLQQRPVSVAVLQQVLSSYFRVSVNAQQFVGRWFTLPAASATSLGAANATLGASAVAGERVWQSDLRVRLHIGPMKREAFRRFLPGRPAALALRELVTLLTGVSLEYEVKLSLLAAEVTSASLDPGEGGVELGWNSFLLTQPVLMDRSDAGYDIHAVA